MYLLLTIWSAGFLVDTAIVTFFVVHILSGQIRQGIDAGRSIYCLNKVFTSSDQITRFIYRDNLSWLIFLGLLWPVTSAYVHVLLCNTSRDVLRQLYD